MNNKKIEVQLANPERYFSKNYHDFMDSTLLNGEEKIIFLALKRFLNVKSDTGNVFPTIGKIQAMTGWGNQKVIKYIKSLIKKGVVKSIRQGLNKPNIYIISDDAEMWKAKNIEELQEIAMETEIEKAMRIVQNAGYEIIPKEKEPTSEPTTVTDVDKTNKTNKNSLSNKNNTIQTEESQVQTQEKYPMDWLKQHFYYNDILSEYPNHQSNVDIIMEILYTTVNTTKPTIKVCGNDTPTQVVISKLLKLTMWDIEYVMLKFNEQEGRIHNPIAYLLTMLYVAHEQNDLDTRNLVNYDRAVYWEQQHNNDNGFYPDIKPKKT